VANIPIRHHIVPQCYLELFTDDKSKLNVFPKDSRPCFSAGVNNVAVRNHYYSFNNELGEIDAKIEHALSEIEGVTKPILNKICSNGELSDKNKEDLAIFLGIMTTRNPNFRDGVERFQKQILEAIKNMNIDHNPDFRGIIDNAPDEIVAAAGGKEHVADFMKKNMSVVVNPEASLEYIHLGLETSKRLCNMRWRFWVISSGKYNFVTSDNPCYVTNREVEKTSYGVGIGLAGSRFQFPVSPTIFLVADGHGDSIEYKDIKDKKQISLFNARTIRYAESEVYSPVVTDYIISLHRKNKCYAHKVLVDQVGPYHILRKKLVKNAPDTPGNPPVA